MFFSDKFQQSKRYVLNVPQIQFFDRSPDIPVAGQRQVFTVLKSVEIPQVLVLFAGLLTPVGVQRQVLSRQCGVLLRFRLCCSLT